MGTRTKPTFAGFVQPLASILLLAVCLLGTHSALAELTARLSASKIDETQTLELIIRTESRDVQGMPDLKSVEADFEVLTTRTSSQYRVINGSVQAWTEWIIALRPLRTGTLRVPSLTYRGESTEPLALNVVPLDPALKKEMGDRVFFETSIEPENPYVQAQTIYVRRLLYADGTQIYGEMPDTPVIDNAVVLVLGNAKSSTVERNGNRYGMIEQRYAIFPERSGEFEIPGAMVSGSVRMRVNNRLRRNGVRVIAKPTTVNVRPIPKDYPKDVPWLPASDVSLLEAWDDTPPVFKLGESVRQTLIVRGDAATGSLIPPLQYSVPESHFRAYPEQPDIADNRGGGGVIGTRSRSWSMIPTAEGAITLPAVSVTWFNTTTERVEVSELPERELRVFGPVGTTRTTQPETQDQPQSETAATPDSPAPVDVSERRVFGPGLIALLLLATGVGVWFARQRFSGWNGNGALTRSLKPKFLQLRTSRAEFLETIDSAPGIVIRTALGELVTEHEAANKPVNEQLLTQLYTTLDAASYARVAQEPDRKKLRALAQELFTPPASTRKLQSLPELYH